MKRIDQCYLRPYALFVLISWLRKRVLNLYFSQNCYSPQGARTMVPLRLCFRGYDVNPWVICQIYVNGTQTDLLCVLQCEQRS